MHLERNLFEMLDRSAALHGERTAFGFEDGSLTFVELRDRALAVARGFVQNGLRPGDRVAVMLNNRREWVEVLFGLAAAGAVCVPVNVFLTAPEVDHVCRDSGSRFLVMDEVAAGSTDRLTSAFDLVVTVGGVTAPPGSNSIGYDELLSVADESTPLSGPDLTDTFVLYYSSGTTGTPKAAAHTHNGILWNAMGQWIGVNLDTTVRCGVLSSLSWAAGFHVLVVALVWLGGYSYIRRLGGATAQDVVAMLVREKITHTFLVPSLLKEILTRPDLLADLRESDLRWVLTGSAPVPRSVIESFSAQVPDVALCQGYGFSEFPPVVCVLRPEEVAEHEGSAGRPLPITSLAVRTDEGEIRTSGRGELLVRSLATMTGYHERPDETAEAFRDGWFHSGDLVDLDQQGFVTIVGRTKDMIISGGLNVYPKEVEDVIYGLSGVLECAVVGVPHEKFGETAAAVIVTDDDDFDPESVSRICADQLAAYKRPRHVLVRRKPLPRNVNAKVLKRDLRPWASEQLGLVPPVEMTR